MERYGDNRNERGTSQAKALGNGGGDVHEVLCKNLDNRFFFPPGCDGSG